MADDYGLTPSTAGVFHVLDDIRYGWSGVASGRIEVAGDQDRFLLDVEPGHLYALEAAFQAPFDLLGVTSAVTYVDASTLNVRFYDLDGNPIAPEDMWFPEPTVPDHGTFESAPGATGPFSLPFAFRLPAGGQVLVEIEDRVATGGYSIYAHEAHQVPALAAVPSRIGEGASAFDLLPYRPEVPPDPGTFEGPTQGTFEDVSSPQPFRRGEPVPLTLLVANIGEAEARDVVVKIIDLGVNPPDPPDQGTFQSIEPTDELVASATVVSIPALGTAEVTIELFLDKDARSNPALAIVVEASDTSHVVVDVDPVRFWRADGREIVFDAPSHGTSGDDEYTIHWSAGLDVRGAAGDDIVTGGAGGDTILGHAGTDTLKGEGGDDILSGGIDDDWIEGGFGDDILAGGAGDDDLFGGDGNDRLVGGDGFDFLDGGAGADLLVGGDGTDRFFFATGSGADRVNDFDADDLIVIEATVADLFEFAPDWWKIAYATTAGSTFNGTFDAGYGDGIIVRTDADVDLILGGNVLLV